MINRLIILKRVLNRHKRKLIIALIPLVILTFIFFPRPQKPIEVQTVKKQDITESISATGTIASQTSIDLHFLNAGKLVFLGVKKGDIVFAGQTIAVLDQRSVQKNLETTLRDYSLQRNSFDEVLEDNQNRTPEQSLNNDMKRILQNNQYNLEKAILSVELQDLAKQQAVLISPIDGIITNTDIATAGVNVTTSTSFTIVDPKNLIIKIDIDEADIGKISIGDTVNAALDAFPETTLKLKIKSIDFAAHSTSTGGNVYTVEAEMPENTALQYRIGMNADVEITTNEKKAVIAAPLSSIVDDNFVYVLSNKKFEKRKVTTGLANETDIEIKSGLKIGDEVALDPIEAEKLAKK